MGKEPVRRPFSCIAGIMSQRGAKYNPMRPGQNRRVRGRNRSKGPNPLTRSYESTGPDVKVRGTAQHVADKYAQLARDAQSSGDPVAAENYYQHAEHYYRIIAGAQEQFRQQFGGYGQRPFDEDGEDGDEEAGPNGYPYGGGERPNGAGHGEDGDFGNQPQPYDGRGSERPQRYERSDRPSGDRGGERYDRNDRFARDRNDRGPRPPERSDRGPQPDRNAPPDRHAPSDRHSPQDRPPPNRNDRRERDDRSDRGERFVRNDQAPRSDRGERPPERFVRDEQPPRETARPDRADERGDGQERDRRREEPEEPAGLPAFLTTPVRVPIAVEEPLVEMAPSPVPAAGEKPEAADGEAPVRPRTRRRRTRYEGSVEAGTPESAAPVKDPTPAE